MNIKNLIRYISKRDRYLWLQLQEHLAQITKHWIKNFRRDLKKEHPNNNRNEIQTINILITKAQRTWHDIRVYKDARSKLATKNKKKIKKIIMSNEDDNITSSVIPIAQWINTDTELRKFKIRNKLASIKYYKYCEKQMLKVSKQEISKGNAIIKILRYSFAINSQAHVKFKNYTPRYTMRLNTYKDFLMWQLPQKELRHIYNKTKQPIFHETKKTTEQTETQAVYRQEELRRMERSQPSLRNAREINEQLSTVSNAERREVRDIPF